MIVIKTLVIQIDVNSNKLKNISTIEKYINLAINKSKIDLVILPEMFCCPYDNENFPVYCEIEGGNLYNILSNIAKKYNIYLVAGSIPEKDNSKIYNTSYVFDRSGNKIAKHRKIHLFDISIDKGQKFLESDTLSSGNDVTVFDTEFGKIGLCICYDFRFFEICKIMVDKGAKAIIVPASFNMTTGPIHWELLFKSRAVDNQVYTIGCSSSRNNNSSYISYGNSILVSPFGEVLNRLDEKEGYFIADIDFSYVEKIRNELPLLKHRRNDLYNVSYTDNSKS